MRRWLAHGRFVLVIALMPTLAAGGCARSSLSDVGRDASSAAPPAAVKAAPSRSDRLRGDPVSASAGELVPVAERRRVQQPAQPEPVQPPTGAEPDPRDVIDWLLKERR